jgi:hypothetical protein
MLKLITQTARAWQPLGEWVQAVEHPTDITLTESAFVDF